ncbi:hypothetical protein FACS1894184_15400 [Clostridia bacterium]|nr:hypothetical protein FACS1894184_15400 [Clostridia bacterium]
MCYSEHARRYLNYEGTARERTFVVGSPMTEVLKANIDYIRKSDILNKLSLEKGKYILLSAHREENIDTERNFYSLMEAINVLATSYEIPILYSCHPRSKKFIDQRGFVFDKHVIQHQPFGFHDYNNLQMNAFAVVSDSGTLPEESSYYATIGNPIPTICVRTSTERPEALDKGNYFIAGITTDQILQAVELATNMCKNRDNGIQVTDYADLNISTKIIKIIQSYTGIIDKTVWRKQ